MGGKLPNDQLKNCLAISKHYSTHATCLWLNITYANTDITCLPGDILSVFSLGNRDRYLFWLWTLYSIRWISLLHNWLAELLFSSLNILTIQSIIKSRSITGIVISCITLLIVPALNAKKTTMFLSVEGPAWVSHTVCWRGVSAQYIGLEAERSRVRTWPAVSFGISTYCSTTDFSKAYSATSRALFNRAFVTRHIKKSLVLLQKE